MGPPRAMDSKCSALSQGPEMSQLLGNGVNHAGVVGVPLNKEFLGLDLQEKEETSLFPLTPAPPPPV